MSKLEEIEGVYRGEFFRNGDFMIGSIEVTASSLLAGERIAIKGDASADELSEQQRYRFYGRFGQRQNPRTGRMETQFAFQTFVLAQSHDRAGIVNYLVAAGKGKGLGSATAEQVWRAYGSESIRLIREDPSLLLQFNKRLSNDQIAEIAWVLDEQKATEDATIELTGLLSGKGLPKTTARAALRRWGNAAAQLIRRDPYRLMHLKGCGFKTADSLWIEFGNNPARLKRQLLCGWYAIASSSDGHTWFQAQDVIQAIASSIGSVKARPIDAIRAGIRLAGMSPTHYAALAKTTTLGIDGPIDEQGEMVWLAEESRAGTERELAKMIAWAIGEAKPRSTTEYASIEIEEEETIDRAACHLCGRNLTASKVHVLDGIPYGPTCIRKVPDHHGADIVLLDDWLDDQQPIIRTTVKSVPVKRSRLESVSYWPDVDQIDRISDHQKDQLRQSFTGRVGILGGSPGTGKTFTTAMAIRRILRSGLIGPDDIAIGAPTGKAAVRLTQSLRAAGVPKVARTWHSLLGFGEGGSFLHNERNPWPYRMIIGDETSMNDLDLMRAIFAARPAGCHVLLVGDVNQLPPVGNGAPFRDLIRSQVAGYGELREIQRNSGGIVEACAAIRDGQPWKPATNLKLVESHTAAQQIDALLQSLRSLPENHDPVWDCQVLVAVNERSELSRKSINKRLQDALNKNPEIKGSPFRISDKVVCLKNSRFSITEVNGDRNDPLCGSEQYVANGELARIVEVAANYLIADLDGSDKQIRIPRGQSLARNGEASAGCNWDLAYGLSAHKSQGSEWPNVIVMLDDYGGARMVCSREWIYTAISRAKEQCILIGRKSTADAMCQRVAIGKRKTFLRELLQLEMNRDLLKGF